MKVITGNLIELAENGEFDVIVHGCNCECIMGGGIAKQIRKAFPTANDADRRTKACDSRKIGSLSFVKVDTKNSKRLVIVNGYTQLLAGGQVNYDAVRDVMKQVKQNFYGQRIGYPMIGSGLAGGEWDRIREIIDEELIDENHTLVQLPTNGKGSKTHQSKSKRHKTDQQGGTTTSPSMKKKRIEGVKSDVTSKTKKQRLVGCDKVPYLVKSDGTPTKKKRVAKAEDPKKKLDSEKSGETTKKNKKRAEGVKSDGTSSNTPDNSYVWNESLLGYLVGKLCKAEANKNQNDFLPNINEVNVRENIGDLILDEDFPEELTPELQNPRPLNLFMPPQGRCPPWVKEIAPFVLERLNSCMA